MDPENDGFDYTNDEHARAWRLVQQNINRRPEKQRYLRFRGRSVVTKKTLIYKECISEEWASLYNDNMTLYGSALSLPSEFITLKTPIPDELICNADRR